MFREALCKAAVMPVILVHSVTVGIGYYIIFLIASGSKLISRLFVSREGTAPVV